MTVGVLKQEVESKSLPAFGTWKRLTSSRSLRLLQMRPARWRLVLEMMIFRNGSAIACESFRTLKNWNGRLSSCEKTRPSLSFLARTPTQRIFDVMQKREAMGVSYTPETLIDLYERNDQFSAKSEKITRGRCMCFVFSSPFFPFSWGLRLTCGVLGPRLFGDGPCFATRQHFAGGLG